ncbi:MAG: hypothetical protein PHV09_03635 [Bacteroidales bacterium]|nr:hypothetical protein [Bacteroidales bacterium]MDD2280803.1 hypothetical protein [Bacteroidales bacterium]MDD4491598.1 hypothetical protein [Bacteroidales bacterium]
MKRAFFKIIFLVVVLISMSYCVKFPKRVPVNKDEIEKTYIYPFNNEVKNATAEISITTDGSINLNDLIVEIPYLKYNKSWLFLLTQDDCMQTAFCSTWAAINGKPLSPNIEYYYDIDHLRGNDLPPGTYTLPKTLGSTDGTGNEVRFSFTTALWPELKLMSAKTIVNKNYKADYSRFKMKSGLTWKNVREMLNYDVGIAFHDVNIADETVHNTDTILKHYILSQKIIKDSLNGRGSKALAEPNGNKSYVEAANRYNPIQTMTAQSGAEILYPYKVNADLYKILLDRSFYSEIEVKDEITKQLLIKKEERKAIHVGVHKTGILWAETLLWLNDTYGKDGNDSVWMPNLEEYYEYNYYRLNSSISKRVSGNALIISVVLPSGEYFYYPSVTINVKGLNKSNITLLTTNSQVTGMSYGNYDKGVMVNLDCRKFLVERATFFVEKYEKNKTNTNLADARYFVNPLKESTIKTGLLNRIK